MYPAKWAAQCPHHPAVVVPGVGMQTYKELDEGSNRLAHLWRNQGLSRGDGIAIVLDNDLRFLEVSWSAHRSGLRYTPLNWHLTAPEIAYILDDCGAGVVVTNHELSSAVGAALQEIDRDLTVYVLGTDSDVAFASLDDAAAPLPTTPITDEAEGSNMVYSSGTTGRPKGGRQPLPDAHPSNPPDMFVSWAYDYGLDDPTTVFLTPGAPLYHAAPLRFALMVSRFGGTNIVLQRFDPENVLGAIETHRVTASQFVPTMFVRLLKADHSLRNRYDLSSLRLAVHAAAPCPVWAKREMIQWWGPILWEYYGASEGGAATKITSEEWLEHPGSVGRAYIGEIHILGEDDEELPPGEVGLVYGEAGLPIEYHNDPERTRAAQSKQGWVTVGDIGYLDEDGYLFLTDRRDFVIVAGGVNIYPQEIEEVILAHHRVADVAVFGVPDPDMGEAVKAVVEPSGHPDGLVEELTHYCDARLPRFKRPTSIDIAYELPRAPSGKLYKRRLRDRYWPDRDGGVI